MSTNTKFEAQPEELTKKYVYSCRNRHAFGSMWPNIYDTAWVSMVSKSTDGKRSWLFPKAFEYILAQQQADWAWEAYADPIDGILNTGAALLAMLKHRENGASIVTGETTRDLEQRIQGATSWLQKSLQEWDVQSCNHVGLEVLVPALLAQLSGYDIHYSFPSSEYLEELNKAKFKSFEPDTLCEPIPTIILHSAEALIGRIDFEKVRHHEVDGSLMGSPAATAAYLMNLSVWGEEAEAFLHRVADQHGDSCFPSAFPTSIFEVGWVFSTLLEHSISLESIESQCLIEIVAFLKQALLRSENTVGFAPGILADADDTSKALQILGRLGVSTDACSLVETFFNGRVFEIYHLERHASMSTNCNALKALILTGGFSKYTMQTLSTVTYLCDSWYSGVLRDKWNVSELYSTMLLAQAFVLLLRCLDSGTLPALLADIVKQRVSIVLTQIHSRVLLQQEPGGSWGNESPEVTAYAVLTMLTLTKVPWFTATQTEMAQVIAEGKSFLRQNGSKWGLRDHLWIEKVTCAMPNISRAYCLAAVQTEITPQS